MSFIELEKKQNIC